MLAKRAVLKNVAPSTNTSTVPTSGEAFMRRMRDGVVEAETGSAWVPSRASKANRAQNANNPRRANRMSICERVIAVSSCCYQLLL